MDRKRIEKNAAEIDRLHASGELLTAGEAARLAGVSGERISQLKSGGTLCPMSAGVIDYFWRADVADWMETRRPGRPRPKTAEA